MTAGCGTHAGYQRHTRRKEASCQPCREAQAKWMRQYRKENPAARERGRADSRAATRALWRLASIYPDIFRELKVEELVAEDRYRA